MEIRLESFRKNMDFLAVDLKYNDGDLVYLWFGYSRAARAWQVFNCILDGIGPQRSYYLLFLLTAEGEYIRFGIAVIISNSVQVSKQLFNAVQNWYNRRTIIKTLSDIYESRAVTFQVRTRPPFRADSHFATEFDRKSSILNAGDPPPYHFNIRKHPLTSGISSGRSYLVFKDIEYDRTDGNRPSTTVLVVATVYIGIGSHDITETDVVLELGTCHVSTSFWHYFIELIAVHRITGLGFLSEGLIMFRQRKFRTHLLIARKSRVPCTIVPKIMSRIISGLP